MAKLDMSKPFAVVLKGGSVGEKRGRITDKRGYPVEATFDTIIL